MHQDETARSIETRRRAHQVLAQGPDTDPSATPRSRRARAPPWERRRLACSTTTTDRARFGCWERNVPPEACTQSPQAASPAPRPPAGTPDHPVPDRRLTRDRQANTPQRLGEQLEDKSSSTIRRLKPPDRAPQPPETLESRACCQAAKPSKLHEVYAPPRPPRRGDHCPIIQSTAAPANGETHRSPPT